MSERLRWLTLAGFILASSIAEAQSKSVHYIGVLAPPGNVESLPPIRGLRDGLKTNGYIEGQNLHIHFRTVATYDELRLLAKQYIESKVDLLITYGGTATEIARRATTKIPIIFIWGVREPVAFGIVKSLAQPGGNVTGFNSEPGTGLPGKRLELFKEAIPGLRRVILFYNGRGENPGHSKDLALVRQTATSLAITLFETAVKSTADINDALRGIGREPADGIYFVCSGLFEQTFKQITTVATEKRIPVWGCSSEHVSFGATFSYDPDRYDNGYRAAEYVDRVSKGVKPGDLPIQQPTKFEFTVNLKTARQISLTIPPNVLARADRVLR